MNRIRGGARRFRLLTIAGIALLFAGEVSAQCLISGPSYLCGQPVQLCAPTGNYEYMWSGPNGFSGFGQCVTVTSPGVYELTVLDYDTWSYLGPCSLVVSNMPPAPAITGEASFCAGESASLSGPAGQSGYQWSGPLGFTASTASVEVSEAGTYQLRVGSGSCWSAPGSFAVTLQPTPDVPVIVGPPAMCPGQLVELFGPWDLDDYRWTGPSGFTASGSASISVSTPGTYTLSVRVGSCWSPPGSFSLGLDNPQTPTISGPDSICAGQTVQLCGPAGMAEYIWTGPSGFGDVTQCVTVIEAGLYTLATRAENSACYSDNATFVLREGDCTPLPPGPARPSCPRPASWWAWQTQQGSGSRIPLQSQWLIGACVDGQAAVFTWPNTRDDFRNALNSRHTLRERALRQFAAVAANVCAWTTEVPQNGSPLVGLDPSRSLSLESTSATTVGAWLSQTDADLVQLVTGRQRVKDVKKAYRRIIRAGYAINHGIGVGPVCESAARSVPLAGATNGDESIEDETLDDDLSIEAGEAAIEIEAAAPNPFSQSTRFVYYVGDTGGQSVELGIYDITGRRIRGLVTAILPSGPHEVIWDGRDDSGQSVRNGVYFVHGRVGADRVSSTLTKLR